MAKETFKPERYPVRVTLAFCSDAERRYFMGQLSDGWGENHCDFEWPWRSGVDFHEAELVAVKLPPEELSEMRRHERLDKKWKRLADGGE